MDENAIAKHVIDLTMKVHTALGPGLLESAYEACLTYELAAMKFSTRRQVCMPIRYSDTLLDIGYRLDLLVNDKVVLEVKAVEKLTPLHTAQILSYLKLGGYRLGLLLNFNTIHMRDGIKRIVHGL